MGKILAHPLTTPTTVHLALKAYDTIRRPRTQAIVDLSRELGRLGDFSADLQLAEGQDEEEVVGERFRTLGGWIAQGDMDNDVDQAVESMQRIIEA